MPTRLIATSFALIAFAAAVLTGMVADNPATTVLWRALVAMIVCYFIGLIIGSIAFRALQEQIDQYKQAHPLESAEDEADAEDTPASSSSAPSEQPQSFASASADRTTSSASSEAAA